MDAVDPLNQDLAETSSRYSAAKNLLRQKVLSGEVGHGQQLAPEMQLCRETNLSRTTMRRAIGELVDEGLLVRYRGKGTFVNFQRSRAQRKLLGAVVCRNAHISNSYDLLVDGAREAARELGYKLVVADFSGDSAKALQKAMSLNELRAPGSLVVPHPGNVPATNRIIHALKAAGQQVVLLDGHSTAEDVPSISSQNEEAMFALTENLIRWGYRRIAFLTYETTGTAKERETGFLKAMAQHNLPVPSHYLLKVAGSDMATQGEQELDVFMAMRERPEAIICLHDRIAMNVMRRSKERGLRVPEDIAVTGFDDMPEASLSFPPLTTVHQSLTELGRRGVELLVKMLKGETFLNHHERLPCNLVIRESCIER